MQVGRWKLRFWPVKKSPAQTTYCRKFVSIRHGGRRAQKIEYALAEEYAVLSTAWVVFEDCSSVTVQQTSRSWLCGSLLITRIRGTAHYSVTCMWHGASHACCVTAEPTTTMRVQNWLRRYIAKTWQLLKVLFSLTRDLFALFVQQQDNISTDTRVSRR